MADLHWQNNLAILYLKYEYLLNPLICSIWWNWNVNCDHLRMNTFLHSFLCSPNAPNFFHWLHLVIFPLHAICNYSFCGVCVNSASFIAMKNYHSGMEAQHWRRLINYVSQKSLVFKFFISSSQSVFHSPFEYHP